MLPFIVSVNLTCSLFTEMVKHDTGLTTVMHKIVCTQLYVYLLNLLYPIILLSGKAVLTREQARWCQPAVSYSTSWSWWVLKKSCVSTARGPPPQEWGQGSISVCDRQETWSKRPWRLYEQYLLHRWVDRWSLEIEMASAWSQCLLMTGRIKHAVR